MAEARQMRMQAAYVLLFILLTAATPFTFAQSQKSADAKIVPVGHRPDMFLQAGHAESIQAVAISPDQKIVASAGYGRWVILWDANTGDELARIGGQKPPVVQILFSPDGTQLASTASDGTVKFYSVATRKLLYSERIGNSGRIAYSPDGKVWVAPSRMNGKSGMAQIEVHESVTGTVVKLLATDWFSVLALTVTADGRLLGSGATEDEVQPTGSVHVWDLQSGEMKKNWPVAADAFSADGRWFGKIDYSGTTHQAVVWDLQTGTEKLRVPLKNEQAMYFSPDGNQVALTDPMSPHLKLATIGSGEVQTLGPQGAPGELGLSAGAFSTDGKMLLAAPYADHTIKLWDTSSGKEMRSFVGQGMVQGLMLSADGKQLFAGSPHGIDVWDLASGKRVSVLPIGYVNAFAMSADGHWLATNPGVRFAGEKLLVLDTKSNKVAAEYSFNKGGNPVGHMAFVVNDSPLKELGPLSRAVEFTAQDGKHTVWVDGTVASSPDGKLLATQFGGLCDIDIWDMVTGKKVTRVTAHAFVSTIAFSPDGRSMLTTGQETRIIPGYMPPRDLKPEWGAKVWDVATWTLKISLKYTSGGGTCAAFSPDGKRLALEKAWDRVDVIDAESGALLETLVAKDVNPNYHQFAQRNVVFSADGTMVFQGAQDGIRVWQLAK